MNEQTEKYLVIGLTVICLSVAGTLFYRSFFGGSGSGSGGNTGDRQIALMCASCGGFEIPVDEFREMMSQQGPEAMMMMPGQMQTMECPKCGKKIVIRPRNAKSVKPSLSSVRPKIKNTRIVVQNAVLVILKTVDRIRRLSDIAA